MMHWAQIIKVFENYLSKGLKLFSVKVFGSMDFEWKNDTRESKENTSVRVSTVDYDQEKQQDHGHGLFKGPLQEQNKVLRAVYSF